VSIEEKASSAEKRKRPRFGGVCVQRKS